MHFVYPPPAELQRLGEASLAKFVRSATAPRTLDDAELRTVLDTVLLDGVPLSIALEEAAETFRKRRRAVTRRRAAPAAPLADPRLDMLEQQVRALPPRPPRTPSRRTLAPTGSRRMSRRTRRAARFSPTRTLPPIPAALSRADYRDGRYGLVASCF